jgi:signal transduction histidine kinase
MSRLLLEDTEVLLSMVEDVTAEITAEHEAAVLEERERLARELHDAVTQTLFTASVLAQTSPRLLETNPAVARHNLVQLDELIRGALAEMRTLLLELRPNELREKSLAQLFNLLAESTLARAGANVIVNADSNCSPPQDVAIALYRIAQESLNNVAKHAMANEVVVNLSCDTSSTLLSIKDDGRGFDPSTIPTGHLGVSIMRSRAQEIGASIRIDSKIGRGTQVSVSWSAAGKESASGDESEHA